VHPQRPGRQACRLDQPGAMGAHRLAQAPDQRPHVLMEAQVMQRMGLQRRQARQFGRQGLRRRQRRLVHQQRDHPHAPDQRGADLQSYPVVGLVEPPAPELVGSRQPARADHDQTDLAGAQRGVDDTGEVLAGGDLLDIHEYPQLGKLAFEPVVQPAGMAGAVVAAIADEDSGHRAGWRGGRSQLRPWRPGLPAGARRRG